MKLQLSGGHWDNGRFYQFVNEVRESGSHSTGYKVDNTAANNFAHRALLSMLDVAERTSLSHAARLYPRTFISTRA